MQKIVENKGKLDTVAFDAALPDTKKAARRKKKK